MKGRGADANPEGRFAREARERVDDGWGGLDEPLPPFDTTVQAEHARTVITRNDSPDIPFEQSINPYRGCETGCPFCYARPSHAYMDLSPGLDFESKLFYKAGAVELLRRELTRPSYRCSPINFGANTDPYQPIERKYRVTRSLLEVLLEHRHPITIVTKHAFVTRDLDLLKEFAALDLVQVFVTVITLDNALKRTLEPRAASPAARLRAVRELNAAGVPAGVMLAPVIPAINDHEIERVVAAAAEAGATGASWQMLRLPYEVKDIFKAWLAEHRPERAEHVMSLVRQVRGGRENDARFGSRMKGEGEFAELIAQRFRAACRKHGLADRPRRDLRTDLFRPRVDDRQADLFG